MCLIAYVPDGKSMPEDHFRMAAAGNSDGIGVMSATDGVAKFVGRKATKRALRYTRRLAARGVRHAVHFRYATHGRVDRANCHPHKMPAGGWLMHNGVLTAYAAFATNERSDTAIFTETLTDVPETAGPQRSNYWQEVGRHIGASNKLVVLHKDGKFEIVNAASGDWIDGVWYSQTYSLYPESVATSYGWRTPGRYEDRDENILDLEDREGESYTEMLRRALERRYGVPIDLDDVHGDLLDEAEKEMTEGGDYVLDTDGVPIRWSDWQARRRGEADADDYAEYMLQAGMA